MESIIAELKRKHYAIARLPDSAMHLVDEAKREIDVTRHACGFFVQSPMPPSCLKLQTHSSLRELFQAVYPIEDICFSFDTGQYLPPGEIQTYKGLSAGRNTDLVCLIALSEQAIGSADVHLRPGDVLFYSIRHFEEDENQLFGMNRENRGHFGLFSSFFPVSHDTYGKKQRELMLRSGNCAILMSNGTEGMTATCTREPLDFLCEEAVESMLRHRLNAYQKLFFFDRENCKVERTACKWQETTVHSRDKAVCVSDTDSCPPEAHIRPDAEKTTLRIGTAKRKILQSPGRGWNSTPTKKKPSPLPAAVIQKSKPDVLEELIDKLHTSMQGSTVKSPAKSILQALKEVESTSVFNLGQEELCETDSHTSDDEDEELQGGQVQRVHKPRPETMYGALRNIFNAELLSEEVYVCRARTRMKGLTENVLYVGEYFPSERDLNESCCWAYFTFAEGGGSIHEIRSSQPLTCKRAVLALRRLLCKVGGYKAVAGSQEHCKTLYGIKEKQIKNDNLYVIHEYSKQPGHACGACAEAFKQKVNGLNMVQDSVLPRDTQRMKEMVRDVIGDLVEKSRTEAIPEDITDKEVNDIVLSHVDTARIVGRVMQTYSDYKSNDYKTVRYLLERTFAEAKTAHKLTYMGADGRYAKSYRAPDFTFFCGLMFDQRGFFSEVFRNFS